MNQKKIQFFPKKEAFQEFFQGKNYHFTSIIHNKQRHVQ
jgi:hypothetical protein